MIHIEHFTFNPFQERAGVVWDDDGKCAFIDPGASTAREMEILTGFVDAKGLKPALILLTHAHFDHIYGVAGLSGRYDIPVYMHEREKETLEATNPYLCKAFRLAEPEEFGWKSFDAQEGATAASENGAPVIRVGSLHFEVLATPGHTAGGVCFLERSGKVLVSGDTLLAGARGRTDHPGGDYDTLMKSIFSRLMCLDGDITVFPGHGPATSIADERMTNPFLLPFNEPLED